MCFPEPQPLLTRSPKLPGTDGRKMSKSYGNTIMLTDPEPVVRQKLKTMVTDPARVRRTIPATLIFARSGTCTRFSAPIGLTFAKVNDRKLLPSRSGHRALCIVTMQEAGLPMSLVNILNPMQDAGAQEI